MKTLNKNSEAEAVAVIELRGHEYAKVGTLAKQYDVSRPHMVSVINDLSRTHVIRCRDLRGVIIVNQLDFRRAIMDAYPVHNGLAMTTL